MKTLSKLILVALAIFLCEATKAQNIYTEDFLINGRKYRLQASETHDTIGFTLSKLYDLVSDINRKNQDSAVSSSAFTLRPFDEPTFRTEFQKALLKLDALAWIPSDSVRMYKQLLEDSVAYTTCIKSKYDDQLEEIHKVVTDSCEKIYESALDSYQKLRKTIYAQRGLTSDSEIDKLLASDTIPAERKNILRQYLSLSRSLSRHDGCIKEALKNFEEAKIKECQVASNNFDEIQLKEYRTSLMKNAGKIQAPLDSSTKIWEDFYESNFTKLDALNSKKLAFEFYTDFLGIQNDKPNGIYQSELTLKVPLNKHYLLPRCNPGTPTFAIFRSAIGIIAFNHLENVEADNSGTNHANTIQYIDSSRFVVDSSENKIYNDTVNAVTTFDLYVWRNLNLQLKLNVATVRFRELHIYLEEGILFFRTPFFDTVSNIIHGINSFSHSTGIFIETDFTDKSAFNLRLNAIMYWHIRALTSDFTQRDGPRMLFSSPSTNYKDYSSPKRPIYSVSLRFAWLYNQKNESASNPDNFVFLRFGILTQFLKQQLDGRQQFINSNFQAQLGANLTLEQVFRNPTRPKYE